MRDATPTPTKPAPPECPCCLQDMMPTERGPWYCHPCRATLDAAGVFVHLADEAHRYQDRATRAVSCPGWPEPHKHPGGWPIRPPARLAGRARWADR